MSETQRDYTGVAIKVTDDSGRVHGHDCSSHADAVLSNELAEQDVTAADWGITEDAILAMWLSDGTVDCLC